MARALILGLVCAGCSSGPPALGAAKVYPLPSDGWKPGQPEGHVIFTGNFDAVLTSQGACAWIGPPRTLMYWPAGYGVRFNPTELIGPHGEVMATKGEYVGFRGARLPSGVRWTQRCGRIDHLTLMLQGTS